MIAFLSKSGSSGNSSEAGQGQPFGQDGLRGVRMEG
jgi:hypothetical protein